MHNSNLIQVLFFIGFILIISGLLVLDLGVFEKKDKVVSIKRAFVTTLIWIFLAIGFGCIIYFFGNQIHGIEDKQALVEVANKYHEKNFETKISDISFDQAVQMYNKRMFLEYITGYLIEYSLSIDNIFVMILIFSAFAVPPQYYKRVLMWGIVGAMIMRFIFIFVAGALISKYEWILILFGLFLIYSGISMFLKRNKKEEMNPDKNPIVRFCSKRWNVTNEINDHSFVKKIDGRKYITPLLLCMITIEFTDVMFAVDSIPAVFSVTKDPYIVFFSNIFAIMGLRSLFFLISGMVRKFRFLKIGLSFLLFIIGVKMILESNPINIEIPIIVSLLIIIGILSISIIASLIFPYKKKEIV
ncbi:MAG: TerC/Alx family metal homeostasis membrane protein [Bacteroidales bacterium]|nr:TerC/Alx family metal homeostasis membrane protein [Bacteroidales bacterium]